MVAPLIEEPFLAVEVAVSDALLGLVALGLAARRVAGTDSLAVVAGAEIASDAVCLA